MFSISAVDKVDAEEKRPTLSIFSSFSPDL